MRSLFAAAVIAAVPSLCLAQEPNDQFVWYGEALLGASFVQDVQTHHYTVDTGDGIFSGRVKGSYDPTLSAGAELGVSTGPWRFGISWDYASAKLGKATAVGTLDGVPFEQSVNRTDLASFGVSADTQVQIVAGNVYYNLPLLGPIRPYVGLGAGAAIIDKAKDTVLAGLATVGARFALNDRVYLGVRYRFNYVSGITDNFGVQYDPIMFHTVSVLIGVYLG